MGRTCGRHADLRTAVHPVTRVVVVALTGSGLSMLAALAAFDRGPVTVAAVGVSGLALTVWASLDTLHAHSDGDDAQEAKKRALLGPHYRRPR